MSSQPENTEVPDRAALLAEAHAAILRAGRLLAPAELAALLGDSWPSRGLNLLALPLANSEVGYPAFQFDAEAGTVRALVLEINEILGAGADETAVYDDPWGTAAWWLQPDARLGSRAPADLLGTEREPDLLIMVRDDVDGW